MAYTLTATLNAPAVPEERTLTDLDDIDLLARLLKAHRNRGSFRGDCSINTWLTGVALNLIRDHARTEKFKFWRKAEAGAVDASDLQNHLRSGGSNAEQTMIARQQAMTVYDAIGDLSPNQRAVFTMRFIEEMELQEISTAMRMPVSTVKTHLHRATKAVRLRVKGAASC